MVTKAWRLMCPKIAKNKNTVRWDWSGMCGDGTRIMEVFNADTTGRTSLTFVRITMETEEDVDAEFEGQLNDGYLESYTGEIKGKKIRPESIKLNTPAVIRFLKSARKAVMEGTCTRSKALDYFDTLNAITYYYGIGSAENISKNLPKDQDALIARLISVCDKALEKILA